MVNVIWHALEVAFLMGWEIFWTLVLGFGLSAIVQAVVPKKQMSKLLPDSSPKSLVIACGLGAASSSCSYASVALTRSIIRKGADFIAGMGFQLASTNLVIELGIIMVILLGWQFAVAEFVGGIVMVFLTALFFRLFVSKQLIEDAKQQTERGIIGKMEGHAKMDMAVTEGPILKRIFSKKGFTAISHYFVMDWLAIWKDMLLGLLIAGMLAAWIPHKFWIEFFLQSHPTISLLWGPIVGPLVAIFSFVCSIGNVPLAVVLWSGGISFGGVIAFIFADLIIIPILDIYRKYYGIKMTAVIFGIYYAAMTISALIIEFTFQALNLVPIEKNAPTIEMSISLNYTSILNIFFGIIAIILLYRFFRTKGLKMLKMMD